MTKQFWKSKIFWVNIVSTIALILQSQFGFVLSPEMQLAIVMILNLIFRFGKSKTLTLKK